MLGARSAFATVYTGVKGPENMPCIHFFDFMNAKKGAIPCKTFNNLEPFDSKSQQL